MYLAKFPLEKFIGQSIGSGQCVAFVQWVTGAPLTHFWKQGQLVKGATELPVGSAIATFSPPDAKHETAYYANDMHGLSHAAIYLGQDASGLQVMDQWSHAPGPPQPVHRRTIFFGHKLPVNDGNLFYVVE
jgi:hypothetical protein